MTEKEKDDAHVDQVYNQWLASQWDTYVQTEGADYVFDDDAQKPFDGRPIPKKPKTLGYVTHDACRGKGDDIEHIPVPFSSNQVFVATQPLFSS